MLRRRFGPSASCHPSRLREGTMFRQCQEPPRPRIEISGAKLLKALVLRGSTAAYHLASLEHATARARYFAAMLHEILWPNAAAPQGWHHVVYASSRRVASRERSR